MLPYVRIRATVQNQRRHNQAVSADRVQLKQRIAEAEAKTQSLKKSYSFLHRMLSILKIRPCRMKLSERQNVFMKEFAEARESNGERFMATYKAAVQISYDDYRLVATSKVFFD